MRFLTTHILGALLAAGSTVSAQQSDKASLKDQLAEFSADLSMPASPAAVHVGLSSESVLMPRNRREFEAGLSNLFKGTGKPTGVLEFAPYYIARGGKLKFRQYRDDSTFRALTKTTIGVASGTRKIDDAEISARGLSLSSVLVDLSDPIYSYRLEQCIDKVLAGMNDRFPPLSETSEELPREGETVVLNDTDEVKDEKAVAEYKACVTAREPEVWNRSKFSVGLAGGRGRESEGAKRKIRFGTGFWVTAQYGFEDWSTLRRLMNSGQRYYDCEKVKANGQCEKWLDPSRLERRALLTMHARRTSGASDIDLAQAGTFTEIDSSLLGARFTFGSQTRSVFLEVSRSKLKGSGIDKKTDQHALGASFRVSENLWLNAVTGRRKLYSAGKLEDVVELQLQYGASSEPLVQPR
jgi:hypothetical protein